MAQFIIQGGNRLKGEIKISGNKNAILPCLSACLLTDEEVTLENVPRISDVDVFLEILQNLGDQVSLSDSTIKVRAENISGHTITEEQSRKLRASILFAGPLLATVGKAEFHQPGGDLIGVRPIAAHVDGFSQLGFEVKKHDLNYSVTNKKRASGEAEYFMEEASVTATENLVMGSVLGRQTVTLKNCAMEPHVVDLCQMLKSMGAQIRGIGSSTLEIQGVGKLSGVSFRIGWDFMELGTYAVAAAITHGEILMTNASLKGMEPLIIHLGKMGVVLEETPDGVKAYGHNLRATPKLHTAIWPGFPTDLMSVAIVLATQANGMSLLHDWMYETRMYFVDKLISMGASITIADPHRVLVYGPTQLFGRQMESPDIRAGMALVLAALIAQGESVINRVELIERGYSNVVENLVNLGANISRVD